MVVILGVRDSTVAVMEGDPVLEEVAFGTRDTVALPVQLADAVEVRVGEGEDETLCVTVRVNCTV